jgi:hypothetical protein
MQVEFAMEITVPMLSEQDRHVQPKNLISAMHLTPSWNRGE